MELTVVAPTLNEADNVEPFLRTVSEALRGIDHEIVIVDDDSPDQTWRVAQDLSKTYTTLRVVRRQARPSLAGSVIDGFTIAAGDAVAQAYLGLRLRDPMSGYFLMWRKDFLRIQRQLSAQGFKILIEIAARLQPQRIAEVPYVFGPRAAGTSKLTAAVAFDYLAQLRRLRATASRSHAKAAHSAT